MSCFLLFCTASPCHHHFTSFQRWEQLLLLFSCCFCVYGLGCKFNMTISYVETRNGLPIFWACFCIYDPPLCTYIFIDKVFFYFFQCTARKSFSTLPTLAASSTSLCSSPQARHYNHRSKRAKRSAKVRPDFFHPNSLFVMTRTAICWCLYCIHQTL